MALDLQDLTVFVAVQRHGSFGRAASELLVTQPAVSERIRHLERVLARQVFERTPRGVRLTPAGEALLPYARRCLVLSDEAVEATRQAEGTPRFVMALHSTFGPRLVPFVVGALRDLPRRVTVRDFHSEVVPGLVVDGVADVGFALAGSARRGLSRVSLPPDPVVCVASREHRIAQLRRPSVSSLRDALIALNAWGDGTEGFFTQARERGIEEWRVRQCADAATAITLAREHGHVAFVARSALRRGAGLREISLAGLSNWTIRLDLLHRTRDRDDPAIRILIDAVASM